MILLLLNYAFAVNFKINEVNEMKMHAKNKVENNKTYDLCMLNKDLAVCKIKQARKETEKEMVNGEGSKNKANGSVGEVR